MTATWDRPCFSWLQSVSSSLLRDLFPPHALRCFEPGETVFCPSAKPRHVFLLDTGLVKIFRISDDGTEAVFGFVQPGQVFGELPAFGDYARNSYASAMATSRAWRIPTGDFQRAIASNPVLVTEVTRQIIERFRRIEQRVEGLVFLSVAQRVNQLLLELAHDLGRHEEDAVMLDLGLTQSDLAALAGSTRQTVNACLQVLERGGIVGLGARTIRVLRPDLLAGVDAAPAMSAS